MGLEVNLRPSHTVTAKVAMYDAGGIT